MGKHPFSQLHIDRGEWIGSPPCAQCGLPEVNERHTLPPAPPLDVREAAAGEQPYREFKTTWVRDDGDAVQLSYDRDQLGLDGPVVMVLVDDGVSVASVAMPLAELARLVSDVERNR